MIDDPAVLIAADREHLWHPPSAASHRASSATDFITAAEGCWLVDGAGRRLIDAAASELAVVHGHRHPHLVAAVQAQLQRLDHSPLGSLSHPPAALLARRLAELAPWGLSRVLFTEGHACAVEAALKLAFNHQQQAGAARRTGFAALAGGWHGATLGALSVSPGGAQELYEPLLHEAIALPVPRHPGEERAALDRAVALLDAHADRLAALVFEPLAQVEAGVRLLSPRFLKRLLQEARARGLLLVADEACTGFGRTGSLLAIEQVGVAPDLLCLAGALTGGMLPLGATLATAEIHDAAPGGPPEPGHAPAGNPLACAAALASLDLFEDGRLLAHVRGLSAQLQQQLPALAAAPGVAAARHVGLLAGIDLVEGLDPEAVIDAARRRGAALGRRGQTLVLAPPLCIEVDTLGALLGIVDAAIREADAR